MTTASQAVLPDVQTAYNNLYGDLQTEAFFRKLASRGYQPQNEKQAAWMLELGAKLAAANEHAVFKQAEAENDPYHQAAMALDNVLDHYGISSKQAQAQDDERAACRNASMLLLQDSTLYNSVLSLKAAEAAAAAGMNQAA